MSELYEFKVKGHLDQSWSARLEGMDISHQPDGTSLITGDVADQAALFGLLSRLRDLGTPLLSVNALKTADQEEPSASQ
jgi:hypothetical protein